MRRKTESQLRMASVGVAIFSLGLTLVTATAPAELGLSPIVARWLTVFLGMLSLLATFLPPPVKYGSAARDAKAPRR